MSISFLYRTDATIIVLALAIFMMISYCSGLWLGRSFEKKGKKEHPGNLTLIAALFGLLGLLLAFTFNMAGSRYDTRRNIVVEEANCIGTAILRTHMYEEVDKKAFMKDFKVYLEARIAYFTDGIDTQLIANDIRIADSVAKIIWERAAQLSKKPSYLAASNQMIPALNAMIDITTTRKYAGLARVPDTILYVLFVISVINAFFAGYTSIGNNKVDWFVAVSFCLINVMVIFIILDLDRPRRGPIKLTIPNQSMIELRTLLK